MAFIDSLGQAVVDPLVAVLNRSIAIIPGLVAAFIVLAIGYIIGSAFGIVVKHLLERSKLDQHLIKSRISSYIGHISVSGLIGGIVKWYIFAFFLAEGAAQANLGILSQLLGQLAVWIPSLLAAIVIMVFGFLLADYAADKVLHAKRKGIRVASGLVRWFILIFVGLIALDQIGINVTLATNAVLIFVGALSVALAIAIGIGLGLALKDEGKSLVRSFRRNL